MSSLPEYLKERRWFRAKARPIKDVEIYDSIRLTQSTDLQVLRVEFADGGTDMYLLPLSNGKSDSPIAEPLSESQYSAFADPAFRSALLKAIDHSENFIGDKANFVARRIGAEDLDLTLDSLVSRAEQSNTSVIYGQKYILKLFRKIEEGVNPDLELGAFLTEHGFANTPAVLGTLSYGAHSAGLLQRFVANRGDAWKYTLDELGRYFAQSGEALGSYAEAARLLGQRTAEMHLVLSQGTGADFAPESIDIHGRRELLTELTQQADITLSLARENNLQALLTHEQEIRARIETLRDAQISAKRIRFHGDYHLGQVLYTGSDFMIIDFEGEPARPLTERRSKGFAMRDVAGMLRSYQYAAYSASPVGSEEAAQRWVETVSKHFLDGYQQTARGAVFMPHSVEENEMLLNAFLLHKALYEVAYELNNRPDWVNIPLRGVLGLLR